MIPLSDGVAARRFALVNVALIAANFIVWLFYELPDLNGSVAHSSFYPCAIDGSCHAPLPCGESWFTAMFMHGSWDHILGNMLFLAVFGKNVEDAFGHLRYLALYVAGGFVAALTQALITLVAGTAADAQAPMLGASGAIAAVLGAYFVLYPASFVFQLVEANFGLLIPGSSGGGTAFFAHVGGFLFGYLAARLLSVQPNPSLKGVT
jgi:membrane associated rhomboid family serine protease